MTISFDLDDTLIPYGDTFAVEPRGLRARLLRAEPLRRGTASLFDQLRSQGWDIWIYTTSHRSALAIRRTLFAYGITVSQVINEHRNRWVLTAHGCTASKHPGLFGVDVHVDDAEGVAIEGKRYGFEVVHVRLDDTNWTETVLSGIEWIQQNRGSAQGIYR